MGSRLRVTREETLMKVAEVFADRSTCSRNHVGVVIARDGRILTTGYNGAPAGMPHCEHYDDQPCKQAVHAEANAIAYAARYGISVDDCELYTTLTPCLGCAQLIINAGIKRVYVKYKYRDSSGLELIKDAGCDIILLYDKEQ